METIALVLLEGIVTGLSIFFAQWGVEKWKNSNYTKGSTRSFNYVLRTQLYDLSYIRDALQSISWDIGAKQNKEAPIPENSDIGKEIKDYTTRIAKSIESIRENGIYKNQIEDIKYFDQKRQSIICDYASILEDAVKEIARFTTLTPPYGGTHDFDEPKQLCDDLPFLMNQINIVVILNVKTRYMIEQQSDIPKKQLIMLWGNKVMAWLNKIMVWENKKCEDKEIVSVHPERLEEDDEGEVLDSYNRIKSSTKEQEKYIKFYLFEQYNKVIGFAKEVAERFASKKNNSNSSEQRENDVTMAKTRGS